MALILLTIKFEFLIEEILSDYIDEINNLFKQNSINSFYMPNELKHQYCLDLLNENIDNIKNKKVEKMQNIYKQVINFWSNTGEFSPLDLKIKFNYGKHGSKEIIKIFNKVCIQNIFDNIKYYENSDSLLEERSEIDIKGKLDSMISIRNNVIHEDTNPNITPEQISEYKEIVVYFLNESKNY
ncbi:hypothetical protein PL321_14480 [Caloramator sp. mosi_1]|uniref:hypothetical protein n=1 Tax=Caloramator sp. mosi_1 TaxID=3023090 RepID=UPI002361E17A|nr:hypothetical protein [Caloramator sp. mosi_1]WDC83743.1 hypothetical protein PL321_14480 [Caloramator sp. mosi_1]